MNPKFEHITIDVVLPANSATAVSEPQRIPDGRCVAIGAVVSGNTNNEIINLSLKQNTNEVLKPADVRFFEKTNGGIFVHSLCPVDIDGGRAITVVLNALVDVRPNPVTIQVLFMVEKPANNGTC